MVLNADKYYLRRFLRARQHDLVRAKAMFSDHVHWKKEFGVEEIVENFTFHEREAFLSLYPQGYHKTDKLVSPCSFCHPQTAISAAIRQSKTAEQTGMLKSRRAFSNLERSRQPRLI